MTRAFTLAAMLLLAAALHDAGARGQPHRDPFARPAPPAPPPSAAEALAAAPAEPAPLRLRALILNGAHSLANIDGDVLAAGERARDYQVLRIDARGVLVARAGRQELLTMNEKEKQ